MEKPDLKPLPKKVIFPIKNKFRADFLWLWDPYNTPGKISGDSSSCTADFDIFIHKLAENNGITNY